MYFPFLFPPIITNANETGNARDKLQKNKYNHMNTNLSLSGVLHLGQLEGDHILRGHLSTSQFSDYI